MTGKLQPVPGTPGEAKPYRFPFLRPTTDVAEVMHRLHIALLSDHHAGNGAFTRQCHQQLKRLVPGAFPLITHSGTAALEMAALLLGLQPGDEVILPSWTFSSSANAVALRGAVPVFVDIDHDTLNIDPAAVEPAITARTRAVMCVHYAGVACAMEPLLALCEARGLALIEDAAQGLGASWRGCPLGGVGDVGAVSFHASKNVSAGEGGAVLVNRLAWANAAEMIWEKGTDRARFSRNEVARYQWRSIGSSYLPSELTAAFLSVELEAAETTTRRRLEVWRGCDARLRADPRVRERLVLPSPPADAGHNGHIYAVRTRTGAEREALMGGLRARGVEALTHYEPLHLAPAGLAHGRRAGGLPVTEQVARTLLRLPMHAHMTEDELDELTAAVGLALA